jgi:glycerophosphoryl diester phosphodiesterase
MVQLIAHRGLRYEKPENTLPAIAAALSLPIHGVEFDVELAKDGTPVVLHQETVVPDANFKRVELAARDFVSRDWVIEHTSEEICNLDAGSWMLQDFAHITVPLLKDVLALDWGSTTAYVELKDATYWRTERDATRPRRVLEAALPLLATFKGKLKVISFNPEILRLLREQAPHIPTILALWTEWRGRSAAAVEAAQRCGAFAVSLPYQVVLDDTAWITAAHTNSLEVHAYPLSPTQGDAHLQSYTPESQAPIWVALQAIGVDAITSDFARESLHTLPHTCATS